jgi:hypothetical protein
MPSGTGVEQAAVYLRMLLTRPGEYRTRWERTPSAGVDYAAVARVLGRLDAQSAPRPGTDLTQMARHALEGATLNPEIVNRFVQAFALRPPHARRLSALMDGASTVRAVSGALLPPAGLDRLEIQSHHQTLSLHESHLLGPDGLPEEHQTIQVIRAKDDQLEALPYCFDTDEIVVEVLRGGSIEDRVHRVADSLYAVNIVLDPPLARGHTTLLRYHSTFFYRTAPPPEFRRGFLGVANDLTMWVRFHPDRVPRKVWLARWDALDQGRIVEQQPVELDEQLSAHCRFGEVERTVVGFHWEWDD